MADGGLAPHLGAGRLSELFGKSTLDQDRFIRTLGWRQAAAARPRRDVGRGPGRRSTPTPTGVNAWIDEHHGRPRRLPFVVDRRCWPAPAASAATTLEPWTPLDTVAWQKVQAWQLGGNFDSEIFRMLADAQARRPGADRRAVPGLRRRRCR